MKTFGLYEWIAYVLVLIGGVNWGLVGLFRLNIVEIIFGVGFLARLVYIVVGIAAGWLIYTYFQKNTPI